MDENEAAAFASEQFACHKCGQTGGWIEKKDSVGAVILCVLHGFHPEGRTIACDRCGEHLRAGES